MVQLCSAVYKTVGQILYLSHVLATTASILCFDCVILFALRSSEARIKADTVKFNTYEEDHCHGFVS